MDPPQPGGDTKEWTVACHWLGPLIDGTATLIRRGLPSDGGSIPQVAQSLVGHPFQMPLLPAFLVHDADYAAELYRRAVCDARLYKFMRLLTDVSEVKRRLIFRAVQLAGNKFAWQHHSLRTITDARSFARRIDAEEYAQLAQSRCLPPLTDVSL